MWLGEQINEFGIGNGISLMIFAGIVSAVPPGAGAGLLQTTQWNPLAAALILPSSLVAVIAGVIFIQLAERRIPVQYAKRVVGRKMYGGQSTYLPIKVNMAGVIPIIFASSVMMIIATSSRSLSAPTASPTGSSRRSGRAASAYIICDAMLIVFFTYFYTAVTFNPIDQADNLKKYGGFIPGIRPGRPTAEFLDRILTRLTLPGAFFLAAMAVLPCCCAAPITSRSTSAALRC